MSIAAASASRIPVVLEPTPQSSSISGSYNGPSSLPSSSGITMNIASAKLHTSVQKHRRMSSTGLTKRRLSDAREAASRPSYVLPPYPLTFPAHCTMFIQIPCSLVGDIYQGGYNPNCRCSFIIPCHPFLIWLSSPATPPSPFFQPQPQQQQFVFLRFRVNSFSIHRSYRNFFCEFQ